MFVARLHRERGGHAQRGRPLLVLWFNGVSSRSRTEHVVWREFYRATSMINDHKESEFDSLPYNKGHHRDPNRLCAHNDDYYNIYFQLLEYKIAAYKRDTTTISPLNMAH